MTMSIVHNGLMRAGLSKTFFVVASFLLVSTEITAGPFEDGLAAAKAGDGAKSLELWRPLAVHGSAAEQLRIALMYFDGPFSEGLNLPIDHAEAAKWFLLAAKQGLLEAQLHIAGMYLHGQGVARDEVRSYMWLRIAAEHGDDAAARNLDIVAAIMTPAQLSRAQAMATQCKASSFKNCD
jgi:hypothetical protein